MAGGEAVMCMNVANAHERELRAGVRHRSTAPQWRSVHSGGPVKLVSTACMADVLGGPGW